jgi:glutamine synthetase
MNPEDYPVWGFDGSSTYQADGSDSDRVLKPVCVVPDPIRKGDATLVLCEVFMPDGVTPHPSNKRAELRSVLDAGASDAKPWFGIEQEYTLLRGGRILGWPDRGYPPPQGPFYCGVGADEVAGRNLVEAHMRACIEAGLLIEGINFEVLLGQAEFQIGAGDPLTVSDHLWIARWLLYRLGEDYDINATLHPKPVQGDWNGTGQHVNFSTCAMRADPQGKSLDDFPAGTRVGMDAITDSCIKFGTKVPEHIAVYGADNHLRLTGKHETCDIDTFRFGIADRGASIRIPRHVATQGCGYLEDRRPAANADPYQICTVILKTVCDLW